MKTKGTGEQKLDAGFYITRYRKNKIIGHSITINLDRIIHAGFNLNGVIAHELVHACQEEYGLWTEKYHDEKFILICEKLEQVLAEFEFDTGKLYSPHTDTD
jgi:hypothetical protein